MNEFEEAFALLTERQRLAYHCSPDLEVGTFDAGDCDPILVEAAIRRNLNADARRKLDAHIQEIRTSR